RPSPHPPPPPTPPPAGPPKPRIPRGHLRPQPGQTRVGVPVPQPPELAPAQRHKITGQLRRSGQVGAIGQHRDHPHPGGESLHQLPPDPVGRVIDPAPPARSGSRQPPAADHRQHHRRLPHPPQELLHEVRPGRDRRAVQEHRLRAEPPGQLRVQQGTVAVAVFAPIVDENPTVHHTHLPRHTTGTGPTVTGPPPPVAEHSSLRPENVPSHSMAPASVLRSESGS